MVKERIKDISAPAGEHGELHRELSAERQRFLKERSESLKTHSDNMLKGDVDTLKRQTQTGIRSTGGLQ